KDGLQLNNRQITLTSSSTTPSFLSFFGTQSLTGSGTVMFAGAGSNSAVKPTSGSLTLGSGIVIRSGAVGGAVGAGGFFTLNLGTVSSQTAGQTIVMSGTFSNQGTVEARNGGNVVLNSGFLSNLTGATLLGGTWIANGASTLNFGSLVVTSN